MKKYGITKVVKLFGVLFVFVLLLQVFLVSAVAYSDFWVNKTSIPIELVNSGGVTTSNGMIYAISGDAGSTVMYDPDMDTWNTKTTIPTFRDYFGVVTYKNKIYVIGGYVDDPASYNGKGATGVNEVYNIETGIWEAKKVMSTPRGNLCTEVVDGKIYAIGGFKPLAGWFDFNGLIPLLTEVYDIETDTWSSKTPPPYSELVGSAVIDNKIYVLSQSGSLMIYDPLTDVWSYGATIPSLVFVAAVGATTGELAPKRLYVIGGGSDVNLV
jgi:N-acetylneuraminic acid mutarotase